jgi:hypothetical protein
VNHANKAIEDCGNQTVVNILEINYSSRSNVTLFELAPSVKANHQTAAAIAQLKIRRLKTVMQVSGITSDRYLFYSMVMNKSCSSLHSLNTTRSQGP